MNMGHLPIYLCFLLFPLLTFHNFKRKIYQDNIGILNIDVSNTVAPNFIDDLLLDIKLQTVHNTVVVSCFNFPHSTINKSSGQNLSGETLQLNDILRDISKTFHPNTGKWCVHRCPKNPEKAPEPLELEFQAVVSLSAWASAGS